VQEGEFVLPGDEVCDDGFIVEPARIVVVMHDAAHRVFLRNHQQRNGSSRKRYRLLPESVDGNQYASRSRTSRRLMNTARTSSCGVLGIRSSSVASNVSGRAPSWVCATRLNIACAGCYTCSVIHSSNR
jgi:hypothetical protein